MQDAAPNALETTTVVERLAAFAVALKPEDVTPAAMTWARHALLDWSGVTLAACAEPAVQLLIADMETGEGDSMLVGQRGRRATVYDAVLINGTAGHALDYDDVIRALGGHPSVPTVPVALALAERHGHSGREALTAIIGGFEVACALGLMTGTSHYERGFHNTATLGTFGAAATAGILLGLSAEQMRQAFGLAASMASGLKCNFGTMTKPFHAGLAAQSGLRAARLAAAGFTSNSNAVEADQGFVATQVPQFDPAAWHAPDDRQPRFAIERTLFKYHAACYGTHGVLEAIGELRRTHHVALENLEAMTLIVNTRSAGNCNQSDPKSGLALKFALCHLAIAALAGEDTAALATYSEATATRPEYVAAKDRVQARFEPERDRMTARVELTTRDGRTLAADADVGRPAEHLDDQWRKLGAKFQSLALPIVGSDTTNAIMAEIAALGDARNARELTKLLGGTPLPANKRSA
ncbi:MAG: MmgE/PrpD family protein [Pseudomonadota bacterium]